MGDTTGTTTYTYDARNQPTFIENPLGTPATYQYDAVGNRTRMEMNFSNGSSGLYV